MSKLLKIVSKTNFLVIFLCIGFSIVLQSNQLFAQSHDQGMQTHTMKQSVGIIRKYPVKDAAGKYYNAKNDMDNHLVKALAFVGKRTVRGIIAMPEKLVSLLASFFTGTHNYKEQKNNDVALNVVVPKPIQTRPNLRSIDPIITWIGHASFLIQIGGFNILTDPIFGNVKAGPFTVTSRSWAPGIKIDELPPIDIIVISHNHADHTDKESLLTIYKKNPTVKIYVPNGNGALLKGWGIKNEAVIENNWWSENMLTKNEQEIKISCLPAYHWSLHLNLFEYRKALWSSWMISAQDKNIYFAGDTAYHDQFKQIASDFPQIDVALMPIAPTKKEPGHLNPVHVDARQAIDAFIDLNARCFIPMHYGVFFRNPESFEHPINVLHEYWATQKEAGLLDDGKQLLFAQCGAPYVF